ncbi:hypothetical protein F2P56_018371 [Juglans regia]|uniref:Protein NIM1-INTERACTING 3-like n=2 Tax=Juglans regia TaxID=51240 RepID=A0A2I4FMJ9_JUGRE|nr:protein NIM1-INTERACTING 3-like [Juglans regia]KAF5462354.1 hypothetical protein F2P56_018371 [Juglans regia]
MELGTASKKRKICHDVGDHQEEDDEQKMEKFYALIKNLCEARESLMMNGSKALNGIAGNKMLRKQKKIEEDKKKFAAWKPSFQPEDFMEDQTALHNKVVVVVPPAHVAMSSFVGSAQREELADHQKENTDHEEGLELDLRLSL